jgi:hypothetical protein
MEEMLEYAKKFIPNEVASNLFNMPTMYEMLLSNTYDLWFAPCARSLNRLPRQAHVTAAG